MNILGIIPARYASTRFPGKALADINGRSMILRVYGQAILAGVFSDVYVATDDVRIFNHVVNAGYKAVMTAATHISGTDRCLEALETVEKDTDAKIECIINIQGDEPYIHPGQIQKVAELLKNGKTGIATLAARITHANDIFDPNVVKVVFNKQMEALYFSRSPVPYLRGVKNEEWLAENSHYKHLGIYGFKTDVLKKACSLPQSSLENKESLEQLRWLENGLNIKIGLTDFESIAIDTPEDLLKITNMA